MPSAPGCPAGAAEPVRAEGPQADAAAPRATVTKIATGTRWAADISYSSMLDSTKSLTSSTAPWSRRNPPCVVGGGGWPGKLWVPPLFSSAIRAGRNGELGEPTVTSGQ